jgi:hypothetical protein
LVVAIAAGAWTVSAAPLAELQVRNDAGIALYAEIGERLQHSERVVFLSPDSYGGPLRTYGEIAGWAMPTARQQWQARARGRAVRDPIDRLEDYRRQGARYFVSTSRQELRRQAPLGEWLEQHCRRVQRTKVYVIYDLSAPPKAPRRAAR